MAKTRKFKNYFLHPQFFFKYWLYIFSAAGFVYLGFFGIVIYHKKVLIDSILETIGIRDAEKFIPYIHGLIEKMFIIYLFFLVAIIALSLILALIYSHRISGPTVSILRYISRLAEGNYTEPLKIRPEDQLVELVDDLNELAQKLRTNS